MSFLVILVGESDAKTCPFVKFESEVHCLPSESVNVLPPQFRNMPD